VGSVKTHHAKRSHLAMPADESGQGSIGDYSSASLSDLEALAAKGDVQAQNELAKRKAVEGAKVQSSSAISSSLSLEA